MDLNARIDVNYGRVDCRTDGWTDERTDRRMENQTPILHLAKAGATKTDNVCIASLLITKT